MLDFQTIANFEASPNPKNPYDYAELDPKAILLMSVSRCLIDGHLRFLILLPPHHPSLCASPPSPSPSFVGIVTK